MWRSKFATRALATEGFLGWISSFLSFCLVKYQSEVIKG
jgi:hypothetical protein